MTGAIMTISEISAGFQKLSTGNKAKVRSTKDAWSAYVRDRWPSNCQAMCEREWGLTPGRANGLVWSNVTTPTIDQILAHKRGGPLVALQVEALRFRLEIETFLDRCADQEREALADERKKFAAREQRIASMEAMAREHRGLGGDVAGQAAVRGGRAVREPRVRAAGLGDRPAADE